MDYLTNQTQRFFLTLIKTGSALGINRCIHADGSLVVDFVDAGLLGGIYCSVKNMHSDSRKEKKESGKIFSVETCSLSRMLKDHELDDSVDYLSLDIEGAELQILSSIDFTDIRIKALSVELNFTEERDKIFELLVSNGYSRFFEEISHHDDWYVNSSHDCAFGGDFCGFEKINSEHSLRALSRIMLGRDRIKSLMLAQITSTKYRSVET